MAEDKTQGKLLNLKTPGLSSNLPQLQTSGQQSTGGVFLPGISDNAELQAKNKIPATGYQGAIESGKIKTNIQLPGINTKPQTTIKPVEEGLVPYEDRLDEQYKGQTLPLIKGALKDSWNNIKKFGNSMLNNIITSGMEDAAIKYQADNELFGKDVSKEVEDYKKDIAKAKEWKDEYIKLKNEEMDKWRKENLNQYAREDFASKSVLQMIKNRDWRGLKYGITEMGAQSLSMMIPTIVAGAVTRDPTVMGGVGFASAYPHLYQEIYEESREYGLTPEQAELGATLVGSLSSLLEVFGFEKVLGKYFTAGRGGYKPALKIFWDTLLELGEGATTESVTEASQELMKNLYVNLYNEDKDVTEGVLESGIYGGILGFIFGSAGTPISVKNTYTNNKQITKNADIEALKYVAEGEQRKAQRMAREKARARFLERVKNPTMDNGYTPTPEQAQQRAREKEENEQFEDELRAEQNRENSRYQETEGENAGLSDTNDYTEGRNVGGSKASSEMATEKTVNTLDAEETISENSSHGDRMTTDSFFSTDENGDYIEYNGSKLYAGETIKDTEGQGKIGKNNKSMFSGEESFVRNPEYEEYRQNFYDFLKDLSKKIDNKTKKEVVLGKTQSGSEVKLTRQQLKHIIKSHGAFSLNDLLETINNPTYSRMKIGGNIEGDGPFFIKQDPNSGRFYYLSFKKNKNGSYNINTFYEITKSNAETLLNKKLENSNDKKYQLKYEEEGYNPGVAGKDEKNISGKEGVNLRNKLNKKTVKELAEKYGIKVEVIEGMIKILENGKKKGYAYGKYIDQLLTLSEQIKESTAPHELLHAIFDMIDPETKTYLISQVMKSEGWSASKAEERLADSFSNFFRTGKIEGAPKSTWGRIKIFFKRVRSFINGMNKWRNELEEIFTDIITADGIVDLQSKIDESSSLNKSKERMRKRFMEYRKNAIKTQERAESENKYQKTGNNEKNEYTNSGQRSDPGIAGKISVLDAPFSFNTKTIQYDGKKITHTYDPKNSFLTDYTFSVPKELQQYVDLFNRAIENGYESAIIGEFDGRYIKIYFNDNFKEHFVKHGGFAPENLIITLNRFDAFTQRTVDGKKRFIFEKQLPNGNYLVAITSTNLTEISFYESKKSKVGYSSEKYQKAGDINSPAFKKRFGDSKVVDKDGNPLVVYHGTQNKFNTFKKMPGGRGALAIFGDGFYFAESKKRAGEFKRERAKNLWDLVFGGKIMEVYLSIQNPYEVTYSRDLVMPSMEELMKKGYDGVKADTGEEIYWIAFKPNQIKSATDNVGTYDVNNYDIRYQRVYHGSPAEFEKFDSSHMGEGEGDQVHGRGHYVAVDPKTGREYAETLAGPRYKGKEMYELASDLPGYQWNVINHVAEQMRDGVDIENAIANDKKWHEYLLNKAEENLKTEKDEDNIDYLEREIKQQKEMIKIVDGLKVSDFETSRGRRNFYEVEIPDIVDADTPTGTNYFEENKVLTRSEIEKILNKLLKRKTQGAERVKNAIDYDLKDGEKIDGRAMVFNLRAGLGNKKASKFLESLGYDGIHYFGGKDGEAYVIFNDDDLEIKNHEKYQKVEYEYDEDGKPKWIKFDEDNSERDSSIFGEPTREEQIADDKENEKNNPFYNAWIKYNNQNYKDDQLTFEEFIQGISERGEKEQAEYDKKLSDISEAQNDPQLLDLQLRAVKLMEEEGNVGKKFGKNVSKEVRDRQQKEVESKREQLISDIVDYMYPGLKTEEITYDMQKEADQKEAEREMLGREDLEEKLKYFKKDKNGNREAKEIKIENPDIKLEKLLSAGKFDEIFTPLDRVIQWKTPQGQHGVIDNQKDSKKYKSVMEKINAGKTKTKVTLKDVTRDYRALEKYKADQEAEKARKKKERDEAYAKKKQEEYKKIVRMKAFQRLVDMQRFEKYPFLTEEEIKNRYGFTDEEWKKITEQEEIKLPKKRGEKAISDLNKAVDSQVKALIEGLSWQNNLKRKDAEKNLGEIGEIDVDILLGRDEEKGQKEVEEFEKLAKEEKEQDSKLEDGKTEFEKEMDRKTRKQKKQAEKLTKQWNEMFRKAEEKRNERYANKEEKKIDEVKSVEEAKEITKESRWKIGKDFIEDKIIKDTFQPLSTRIEKISPRVYREMMRFEQNITVKNNIRMKQVEDFVKKMAKIRSKNKKDYLNITLNLLNGNVGTANQMLEKYGTSIPRQLLDEIWADAEDVGYTMNYEGFYYPRKVKDVKDFLDRFAKTENKDVRGEIDKIIEEKEKKARARGEEFTPQMKADLINQLLLEGEIEGISLGSGHMKKRKVESITKNMLKFYEDPVDSLLQYITGMTEAIEKARFLGQGTRGEIKTLGEFIADEGISGYDADELKDLLLSRFNYVPMGPKMAKLKVIGNIIHLGNPSTTLTQLGDFAFSFIENGLTNVIEGLTKKYNLDLNELGITNLGEEYKSQGKKETKLEKVQRFIFKKELFNWMDQFGKRTFVVSTLNKLIKYAKRNDPQLRKDLSRRFDDPKMIDEVINDLKEGKISKNVSLFLFTKLSDVQPLTRLQMPKTYQKAGNWRILYAFKTYGIKKLDYILQTSKRELATKPTAEAVWKIVSMALMFMLFEAGTDEIKDALYRRRYNSLLWRIIEGNGISADMLSDKFWDSFWKMRGFNRYVIYQARTEGIKSAVEGILFSIPGLDLFTYPLQDLQDAISEDGLDWTQASTWQLLPLVGKAEYRWVGAGQTKQQKKLDKENKKNSSSGGSSRSTRTTRSRNTRNTRNSR